MKNSAKISYILGTTVISLYLLMIMGTFVTSTGSGLACPDWPLCYGTVTPPMQIKIWFEWGHRLLGGLTGLLVLLSTLFVWLKYRGIPRILTSAVLVLLLAGILMGGITVLIEAPYLDNIMRIAIVSSHLTIATLVLIALILTLRRVNSDKSYNETIFNLRPAKDDENSQARCLTYSQFQRLDNFIGQNKYLGQNNFIGQASSLTEKLSGESNYTFIIFSMVYIQVILGILVRYSKASLACPDFPFCQGYIIPPITDYTVGLHFFHRANAIAVLLTSGFMLYKAIRKSQDVNTFFITFTLVILQAIFGILIVKSGMFLPFIIMHGATGFFLLGWLAYQSAPFLLQRLQGRRIEMRGAI